MCDSIQISITNNSFLPLSLFGQTHVYNVKMTCGGCSGAVDRVLKKQEAAGTCVSHVIDMDAQTVSVETDMGTSYRRTNVY